MKFQRSEWRRIRAKGRFTVALAASAAFIFLALASEFIARSYIAEQIAAAAERKVHVSPDVSLGSGSALLQMTDKVFDNVEVKAERADLGGDAKVDFVAQLSGLTRTTDGASVNSSKVRAEVTTSSLTESMAKEQSGGAIEADPGSGTLIAHVGPGGLVQIPLKPSLDGKNIKLKPGEPTFNGNPMPSWMAETVTQQAERIIDLTDLPLALQVDRLTVTSDGLQLDLSGGAATFDE
jgi:hypothetical protein